MTALNAFCYGQRMLNPFRGVMNVIDIGDADAVSTDGINWTLYLRDAALQGIANDGDVNVEVPDIKFGTWNPQQGLKRAPLLTTMDYDAIQVLGGALLNAVKQYSEQVPFPLRDRFELWLLDKYLDRPLALIHSVCYQADINTPSQRHWSLGFRCRDTFHSDYLTQHQQLITSNAADWLSKQVNQSAGPQARCQWFVRSENGSGIGLHCAPDSLELEGRMLGAHEFPELMLSYHWLERDMAAVVYEFINWQAPWLLLLQRVSDNKRSWLEQRACQQAILMNAHYRLYPKVIDQKKLNAARVEAKLRLANTDHTQQQTNEAGAYITGAYY